MRSHARPHHLLQEGLQQRGHRAQPEREDKYDMFRPSELFDRILEGQREASVQKIVGAAQQGKVQLGDVDAPDIVAGGLCALLI